MNIGERIKYLLKIQKKTGRELADFVGVSPGSVTGWLQGSFPSSQHVVQIAKFLGVSSNYLLTGEDDDSGHYITKCAYSDGYVARPNGEKADIIKPTEYTYSYIQNNDVIRDNEDTNKAFGNRLRFLLKLRNKTSKELSEHIGVAQASVSNWLQGHYPSAQYVVKIADFLETPVRFLIAGDNPHTPEATSNNYGSELLTSSITSDHVYQYKFKIPGAVLEQCADSPVSGDSINFARMYDSLDEPGKIIVVGEMIRQFQRMKAEQSGSSDAPNDSDSKDVTA